MDRTDSSQERMAYKWAVSNQGYVGTYEQWLAMDEGDREEYEVGAQGIPTG